MADTNITNEFDVKIIFKNLQILKFDFDLFINFYAPFRDSQNFII